MKIVHCLIQYLPRHIAGTEVYTHTLAKLQKSNGHQVAVITPHIEYYRPGKIIAHYQYEALDVYQFMETANPTDRDVFLGKKRPEGIQNFEALLKLLQPDIIHFHELNRSIGLTIEHVKIAKLSGAKVFITMHLSFYTCNTNVLVNNNKLCPGKIDEYICSVCTYKHKMHIPAVVAPPLALLAIAATHTPIAASIGKSKLTTVLSVPAMIKRIKDELMELAGTVDQIIALTNWYKNILLLNQVPFNKITVIPQALATTANSPDSNKKRGTGLPVKIVFLGRIQSQKGVDLLIEAAKNFTVNELVVDIYGKEEPSAYYKKCMAYSFQQKNICWKGSIKREEVIEMLGGYDFLCLPSLFSEMSPLVIQEAFAAGLPVIASRVYGNIEQISHGQNGLLFNFNSVESLAGQIKLVINTPELITQMKTNILPPANFNSVYNSYQALYQTEKVYLNNNLA